MNMNEQTERMTDEALKKWIDDLERDIHKLVTNGRDFEDERRERLNDELRRLRVMQRWIKAVLQSRIDRN